MHVWRITVLIQVTNDVHEQKLSWTDAKVNESARVIN